MGIEPLSATLRVQAYLGGGRCVHPVVTEGRCVDLAATRNAVADEPMPFTCLRCCCGRRASLTLSTTRRKTSFGFLTVSSPSLGSGRTLSSSKSAATRNPRAYAPIRPGTVWGIGEGEILIVGPPVRAQ